MRILWHSSSPAARTGYGIQTREITRRLISAGHFVRVGCKHESYKWEVMPDGLEVFEGTDMFYVNAMLEREAFDRIVTLWDVWILQGKRLPPQAKWIAYVPVNTEKLAPAYADVLINSRTILAQTKWAQGVLLEAGLKSTYIPHGINTAVYRPDSDLRRAFRADVGWTDENFVVGMVGINYADDTKGVIPLMRAFKEFHERHGEARLLLVTLANERETVSTCVNYAAVADALGLRGLVAWPDQQDYYLCRMTDDDMRRSYNGMDVFCLPSRGESFGLPIVEAASCGVPVIIPDKTSGPELVGPGWLIKVDMFDDAIWTPSSVWRYYPRPSKVLARLEDAYAAWKDENRWLELKATSRAFARQYDWDVVWPEYWEPFWRHVEEEITRERRLGGGNGNGGAEREIQIPGFQAAAEEPDVALAVRPEGNGATTAAPPFE